MEPKSRRALRLKVHWPRMNNLRLLSDRLGMVKRSSFALRYGNLLGLVETNVQEHSLSALAQFYDPPVRCFTFRDFQLAPTVEEFQSILACPKKNNVYHCKEGQSNIHRISSLLNINANLLKENKRTRQHLEGFTEGFLKGQTEVCAAQGRWEDFMAILALLIYGLVLFPTFSNFIDSAAIEEFIAYKCKDKNPAMATLANTYYVLTDCHEKAGGTIH